MAPDGRLDWTPPDARRWRIVRFGYTLTGARNHPAPRGGAGHEVDKLSADAMRRHMDSFVGRILRAAGDASFTMSVSIVSMWVFRVGFCYLMVLCFHGQLLSIWMGMFLDWVFRSVCFMVRFVRGKWLEQHVI